MRERSLGLTMLAVVSIVIGLYSLVAGIALLVAGLLGTLGSATTTAGVFVVGALFMGIAFTALLVGGGFWLHKHWAWAGGMVMFGALIAVSLLAVPIGASLMSALLPIVSSVAAMWFMTRASVRRELLGAPADEPPTPEATS